jgi:hypothetical protein
MRLSRTVALLTIVTASATPGVARADDAKPPSAPAPQDRARLTGTFRFVGDRAEEAARRAAIDRAIGGLFFAIRGIARSRLSSGTKIDPWVTFAFDADRIRVRVPSGPEAVAPDGGAPVEFTSDGERVKLSHAASGSRVTQTFVASEGKRVNEWVLSPDGSTLSLRVIVSSTQLTTPVVYTLTYKRSS